MSVILTIEGPGGVRTWSTDEDQQIITVGRDPGCDIVLADNSVSRHHLRLQVDGEVVRFEDLRSAAGVSLNGQRVTTGALLVGEQLQVTQWKLERVSKRPASRKQSAPRLALEVTHPARPKQRFEFLTRKGLAFEKSGQVTTNGRFGRGGNPELLFIQWWAGAEPAFHSVGVRRGAQQQPHLPAVVNGTSLDTGTVKMGDRLAWHDLTIVVSEVKSLRPPEWGMAEAARQSDTALQVYADWLETQGDDASAEWARLIPSRDEEATRARMAVLAKGLGASFRSTLARGPVERCAKKGCNQRWETLSPEEEPWERTCTACTRTVTWCEDAETARSVVGPVVLDPTTPREPADLLPRPMLVG